MEPIRILHVVGRMDRGGIETMIMNIYRNIDRSLVQFDFLAHYGKENADYNEEIRSLGGKIYEMPVIKTIDGKLYYDKFFEYRRALIDFFREHGGYRVLHGHMTNTAAIYMPVAKKYGGVPCRIAHSHSTSVVKGVAGLATGLLHKLVPMVATDYFTCSLSAASWIFRKKDIESGKVTVVRNGVDTRAFSFQPDIREKYRRELGVSGLVIGNVARFQYFKNQAFLVDMMPELLKIHPDATLILVGDGPDRADVEAKAKAAGVYESIRFLGLRSDISALEQAFDVFALPSHFEGQPVTLIEAQCAGLPCVVSAEAVSAESDVTGGMSFVSLNESPAEWAKKIAEAAQRPRADGSEAVRAAGYNCADTAKFLQEFYLMRNTECGMRD